MSTTDDSHSRRAAEEEPGRNKAPSPSARRRRSAPHRSTSSRPPSRPIRTTSRAIQDEADLAANVCVPDGSPEHRATWQLLQLQQETSRQRAHQIRLLSTLWVDPSDEELRSGREVNYDVAAVALRTTHHHASTLLRDAHTAVTDLPRTLEHLTAGDMPAEWFDRLLHRTRGLTSFQRTQVDERVSTWPLADLPVERFRRELGRLITWFTSADAEQTPEQRRAVDLHLPLIPDGTATVSITGPIPEIMSLWNRLDACTRAVQDRQRLALDTGTPVPFDLDGAAAENGRPLSLEALRYTVLTRTMLDTGGIEVPTDRFRMNILVPFLTLLGIGDAPGMLDGRIPIPADTARLMAADQPVWHRILTDPATGAFLPTQAKTYRPTTAMLELLRLRNPDCAAPGCTRSTIRATDADHIIEFNQSDPDLGGPTAIENLHLLCWKHHRLKTEGRIDPVRGPTEPEPETVTEDPASGRSGDRASVVSANPADGRSGDSSAAHPGRETDTSAGHSTDQTTWTIGVDASESISTTIQDEHDATTTWMVNILADLQAAWETYQRDIGGEASEDGEGGPHADSEDPPPF